MPEMPEKTMQDYLQSLRLRYAEHMPERIQKLECLHEIWQRGTLSQEEKKALAFQAHQLRGTGATYGFPEISKVAALLEDSLQDASGNIIHLQALLMECRKVRLASQEGETAVFGRKTSSPATEKESKILPTLLVVDDDPNVRQLLQELFREDARVLTGTNSAEALSLMKNEKPDLVLLDDMMPGDVSGLRLLENIRAVPELAQVPVIMITGSDQPKEVMRGLMAGAVDYIVKPFDPKIVAEKIRTRLKRMHTTILIADDDEAIRNLLAHKFRSVGCHVALAEDGEQAWEMMQEQKPAIAILDRMMPGADGIVLLQRMRQTEHLADVPVIFLTARRQGADVLEGLETGAADYIVKPFNPDEVLARCARLLSDKK